MGSFKIAPTCTSIKSMKKKIEMKTFKSNKEIADGTIYDSPLTTSWRAPTWILEKGKDYWNKVRSKMKIIGTGKILPRTYTSTDLP